MSNETMENFTFEFAAENATKLIRQRFFLSQQPPPPLIEGDTKRLHRCFRLRKVVKKQITGPPRQ